MSIGPPENGDDDLSAATVCGIRAVLRRYEGHQLSLDDAVREIRELIEHDRAGPGGLLP